MENTYSIRNFKTFDSKGASVDFSPITFITGENSSGKSSIVKSLVLFERYLKKCQDEFIKLGIYRPFNNFLSFSDSSLKLGRYSTCYCNSANKDDGMKFSYKIYSELLNELITVTYTFKHFAEDDLDNGHLWSVAVDDNNGEGIFELRSGDHYYDHYDYDCCELVYFSLKHFTTQLKNLNVFDGLKYIKKDDASIAFNLIKKDDELTNEEQKTISDFIKGFKSCDGVEDLASYCYLWLNNYKWGNEVFFQCENDSDIFTSFEGAINDLTHSGNHGVSVILRNLDILAFLKGRRKIENVLSRFYKEILERFMRDVFFPDFIGNINYIGTSKVELKRLYTVGDNSDLMGNFIEEYFSLKKKWGYSYAYSHNNYYPGDFINKWIGKFKIGDKFELEYNNNGQGVTLYIDGRVVADEGYGITQLLTIMINIEKAILSSKCRSNEPDEVGCNYNDYDPQTLVIEEPEVHLHPNFQSMLADMFYDAYHRFNIHFIIETHSEYLIRRSQVLVAQGKFDTNEAAEKDSKFRTIYVPRNCAPYSLGYRKDGRFAEDFGSGFFDESARQMFQIL